MRPPIQMPDKADPENDLMPHSDPPATAYPTKEDIQRTWANTDYGKPGQIRVSDSTSPCGWRWMDSPFVDAARKMIDGNAAAARQQKG